MYSGGRGGIVTEKTNLLFFIILEATLHKQDTVEE